MPTEGVMAAGLDPMGNGLGSTFFMTVFRVATCENETLCHAYLNYNWTVVKATPRTPRPAISFGGAASAPEESHACQACRRTKTARQG